MSTRRIEDLKRGYRLLAALSDLALRHLAHDEADGARETVDSILRALDSELGGEARMLAELERAGASPEVLAEMREQEKSLRAHAAEAMKWSEWGERRSAVEALQRLRRELHDHEVEAAMVVYPMVAE
jgi:hypothetical protein